MTSEMSPDLPVDRSPKEAPSGGSDLYGGIREVLLASRLRARQAVNTAMVQAYWQIGRLIVEAGGKAHHHFHRVDHFKLAVDNLANLNAETVGAEVDRGEHGRRSNGHIVVFNIQSKQREKAALMERLFIINLERPV